MSAETKRWSWTQPQCAKCWSAFHPTREPVTLNTVEPEKCVSCGSVTVDGIYIRIDPADAPHPSLEKD